MSKRVHSDSGSSEKKRRVSLYKWKTELNKECNTLSWLECESNGLGTRKIVEKLKCKVCVQDESKIMGRRNYSDKWIS